jgi:hypothetical protein
MLLAKPRIMLLSTHRVMILSRNRIIFLSRNQIIFLPRHLPIMFANRSKLQPSTTSPHRTPNWAQTALHQEEERVRNLSNFQPNTTGPRPLPKTTISPSTLLPKYDQPQNMPVQSPTTCHKPVQTSTKYYQPFKTWYLYYHKHIKIRTVFARRISLSPFLRASKPMPLFSIPPPSDILKHFRMTT